MRRADLAELLESGPAILGAAADAALVPSAFRVWGAWFEGDNLRALTSVDVLRTIGEQPGSPRMALLITDITTFRSVQVKGTTRMPPAPPTPDDVDILRRYHDRFTEQLAKIGHPPLLADRLRPVSVVAIVIAVDAVFDQTPGPDAGIAVGARLD
jgi:hypothetical protein